jgi:drug/metabolite transporter (DMT)-like permease
MPTVSSRGGLQRIVAPLTLASFLVAVVGGDIGSQIVVSEKSTSDAISDAIKYSGFLGTAMLAFPFIAADLLSVEVGRRVPLTVTMWFFAALSVALIALYFLGYWSSRQALLEHKWTASALAVGLLPMQSLPILLVGLIVGELLRRRYKHET